MILLPQKKKKNLHEELWRYLQTGVFGFDKRQLFLGSLIFGGETWGKSEKTSGSEEHDGSDFGAFLRGCAIFSDERLMFGSEVSESEGVPLR